MDKPTNLLVASVRRNDDLIIIDMDGDIDSFADEALENAYSAAEAAGDGAILLNFSNVGYINSTGIALIVGMLARARKSHRKLMTAGLTPHYEEIFNITRLSDFMDMYPDEESARNEIAAA